tara:strand:+ start:7109 stop:7522 length:414 start_codon:yes stop_codon:yes gene_type:complete
MLVSKIVEKIDIPHEEGQWVEIRSLSFTAMEEANDNKQERDLMQVKRMGGDVFEAIVRSSNKTETDSKGEDDAPKKGVTVDSYDKETLLRKAIVGWSYDGKPTLERIRDLDARTANWLAREIYERNKPDTEEDSKND